MLEKILSFIVANPTLTTVSATILVTFVGFIVKYLNDLAIARRRDRLDRVNSQLRLLYGPLFALTSATDTSWSDFRKKYRPNEPFFSKSRQPTENELQAWRLWMSNVFMPLNRRMSEAIISNADLLEGSMPPEFQKLLAHVAAYEVVLARWQEKDFGEHTSSSNFPDGFRERVMKDYEKLRSIQNALLSVKQSAGDRRAAERTPAS